MNYYLMFNIKIKFQICNKLQLRVLNKYNVQYKI